MIRVDLSKCTGCRRCETACAFFHTGKINNRLSRIKVSNIYETGIDGPVACVQCSERYCMRCPKKALSIGPHGEVIASPTVCNLCGACQVNCPIGAIEIFEEFVFVCDLCGGNPKCIDACTENAISFIIEETETVSLAETKKETKKMNPSQKRDFHIRQKGEELRKKWRKTNA